MSLHASAQNILSQLKDVIEQFKPADFSAPVDAISGSTVGQHIRHTIEFFLCLMDTKGGVINYDERKHDTVIETDPKLAVSVIGSISDFLEKKGPDVSLVNEANYDIDNQQIHSMKSSLYRELAYNIEHAIHHMALLKVAIRLDFDYVKLPAHFGVASSTVRFQQEKEG